MEDEITTQSVENAQAAATVSEPSLEDVYREAGITEPQAQSKAAPVVQVEEKAAVVIPDAYDEKHKDFLQDLLTRTDALQANQQASMQKEADINAGIAKAKLEEDIKEAVSFVKDNSGLDSLPYDDATKMKLARFELEERAQNDPKFKALWNARNSSPAAKAAMGKAMSIISKEIGKKFEATVDTKLAANRKALKAAHQSSATTESEASDESPLSGLQGAAFDLAWANMVRTNN